jgi:hypothetical protein
VSAVVCFKIVTVQEKAHCVEWFIETKSTTQVQQNFKKSVWLTRYDIKHCYDQFMETGSVLKVSCPGRPCVSEDQDETTREAFQHSPIKSTCHESRKLQIAHSTTHRVLRKHLKLYACKVQTVQALRDSDKQKE